MVPPDFSGESEEILKLTKEKSTYHLTVVAAKEMVEDQDRWLVFNWQRLEKVTFSIFLIVLEVVP
jgi:hypothetical protein